MDDWKGLTVIRVIFAPLADTISYAAGLTRISFKTYFWATMPLIVLHIIITNNVSAKFVTNPISYLVVVLSIMSLSLVYFLFRRKIKKLFIKYLPH